MSVLHNKLAFGTSEHPGSYGRVIERSASETNARMKMPHYANTLRLIGAAIDPLRRQIEGIEPPGDWYAHLAMHKSGEIS
jgi:hypothetical protein